VTAVAYDGPLGVQQARSIAQSNGAINIWDGAIRSGKTVASLLRFASFVVNEARKLAAGCLVITGKTHDTIARNVFGPLMSPALMGRAARLTTYTRGAPTGTILGQEVEVISGHDEGSEARLRGLTARGWYADECSLLPESFFDQLVGRASVPGARGFGTTNPGAPNHWFKIRYLDAAWATTGPDIRSWHFVLEDNPVLTRDYIELISTLYTGMWFKRMILGKWVMAEGAIFDAYDEDRHLVDHVPEGLDYISSGIDYGTTNPFAALLIGLGIDPVDGVKRLWVTDEYRYDSKKLGRQMSDQQYSEAVRGWLGAVEIGRGVRGVRPRFVIVDPSAASFRVQLHRDGLTNWPGDNAVIDGIRTMSTLFAADRVRIKRSCKGLIGEIPGYSWDPKAAAKGEDVPMKTDDHSVDAARYGIRTTEAIWHGLIYPQRQLVGALS